MKQKLIISLIIGVTLLTCQIKGEARTFYWAPKMNLSEITVAVTETDTDEKENEKTPEKENHADREIDHQITTEALTYLGVPYVWGGTTPQGFDCSGLVQYVFGKCGKQLPRVTTQQEKCGNRISLDHVAVGDLYFWGHPGQSYHVAIALGGGKFI